MWGFYGLQDGLSDHNATPAVVALKETQDTFTPLQPGGNKLLFISAPRH